MPIRSPVASWLGGEPDFSPEGRVFALPLVRHLSRGVVYAVDVEPRQLDALRERLLAEGVANVVSVLASYSYPHLPPDAIDWTFIVDTCHHWKTAWPTCARCATTSQRGEGS